MKKSILFLALSLVTAGLVGCGDKAETVQKEYNLEDYVKFNLPDYYKRKINESSVVSRKAKIPENAIIFDELFSYSFDMQTGILPLITKDGYIGIYSIIYGKYIVAPYIPYSDYTDPKNIFSVDLIEPIEINDGALLIALTNRGKTVIVDNLGNLFYEGVALDVTEMYFDFERADVDESIVQPYRISFRETNDAAIKYYYYKNDGTLITDLEYTKIIMDIRNDFNESGSLAEQGHPDLYYEYKYQTDMISIKDKSGALLSQYYLPYEMHEYDEVGNIGDKVLMQVRTYIDYDDIITTDFTYSYHGDRYILQTVVFDILTGTIEELDLEYVIHNIQSIKDENGVYSLAAVTADPIIDGVRFRTDNVYLIDSDLNVLDIKQDYLGEDISKVTENRYVDEFRIFDENVNIVHQFGENYEIVDYSTSQELLAVYEYIVGSVFIYDLDGNKIDETRYDDVYFSQTNDRYIGRIRNDEQKEFYVKNSKGETIEHFVADKIETRVGATYLYFDSFSGHKTIVLSRDGTYACIEDESSNKIQHEIGLLNDDLTYLSYGEKYGSIIFEDYEIVNVTSNNKVKCYGTELYGNSGDGLTYFSPKPLTLGGNQGVINPTEMTYFYYTPAVSGIYSATFEGPIEIYFYKFCDGELINEDNQVNNEEYFLTEGVRYIIELYNDSLGDGCTFSFSLVQESKALPSKNETVTFDEPVKDYIRSFNVQEDGYYRFETDDFGLFGYYRYGLEPIRAVILGDKTYYKLEKGLKAFLVYQSVTDELVIPAPIRVSSEELMAVVQHNNGFSDYKEGKYISNDTATESPTISFRVVPGIFKIRFKVIGNPTATVSVVLRRLSGNYSKQFVEYTGNGWAEYTLETPKDFGQTCAIDFTLTSNDYSTNKLLVETPQYIEVF